MTTWHKSIFRGAPWYTAVDKQNGIRLEIFQGGPDKEWFTNISVFPEENPDFPAFKGSVSGREAMREMVEKLERKCEAYQALRDAVKERLARNDTDA